MWSLEMLIGMFDERTFANDSFVILHVNARLLDALESFCLGSFVEYSLISIDCCELLYWRSSFGDFV